MRIGIFVEDMGRTVDEYFAAVRAAAAAGLKAVWLGERGMWDPLTLLARARYEVPNIGLGAAVVRTYPRHPLALAAQALTVGDGFTLGVGPANRLLIEGPYGYSFDRPVRHVREYLTALIPLLHGESVDYQGETLKVAGQVLAPGSQPPPVLLSALGPQMLKVAGELTDGTAIMWTGPRGISDYVLPTLSKGGSGRQVVANVCVCVTEDPDAARQLLNDSYPKANEFYRATLDREGVATIGDTLVAGDESAVREEIKRFEDAGTAEIISIVVGTPEQQRRTIQLLGSLA